MSTLLVNTVLPVTPPVTSIALVDSPISVNEVTTVHDSDDTVFSTDLITDKNDATFSTVTRQNTTSESPSTQGSDASSSRPRRTNAGYNLTLHDFIVPTTTKTCKCGGTDHQKTNSSKCPLNKKNLESNPANMTPVITTTNETQTSEVLVTSNAMEED